MSASSSNTRPESGLSSPTIMLNDVVLPAPFGPSRPITSPPPHRQRNPVDDTPPSIALRELFRTQDLHGMGRRKNSIALLPRAPIGVCAVGPLPRNPQPITVGQVGQFRAPRLVSRRGNHPRRPPGQHDGGPLRDRKRPARRSRCGPSPAAVSKIFTAPAAVALSMLPASPSSARNTAVKESDNTRRRSRRKSTCPSKTARRGVLVVAVDRPHKPSPLRALLLRRRPRSSSLLPAAAR